MTPKVNNLQHLRQQASQMQKLGNALNKNAKTPKDRLNAQVCLKLSEVATLLANYVEQMDKEKGQIE